MRADSIGSGPVVVWPSVSRMIAADAVRAGRHGLRRRLVGRARRVECRGLAPRRAADWTTRRSKSASGKIIFSATRIPLPMAVPRCSWNRSIAARMSSRLCVGDCTTDAVAANDTTPMRVVFGWSATNARAASCAATMRLGLTSVARMLPETSIARITVSCCDGSVTTAAGRAIATSISARAPRNSSGGTCRRKRWPALIASLDQREARVPHARPSSCRRSSSR